MYEDFYWFRNFEPDFELYVTDKSIEKWIKKLEFELVAGKPLKWILYDSNISKELKASVYYIYRVKMDWILTMLSEKLLGKGIFYIGNSIKLNFEFGAYIFIVSERWHLLGNKVNEASDFCLQMQEEYNKNILSSMILSELSKSLKLNKMPKQAITKRRNRRLSRSYEIEEFYSS